MIGPRGLERSPKPWEPPCDLKEVTTGRSCYIVERAGGGFIITVHRRGQPATTIFAESPGEAHRIGQELSAAGLIGVNRTEG